MKSIENILQIYIFPKLGLIHVRPVRFSILKIPGKLSDEDIVLFILDLLDWRAVKYEICKNRQKRWSGCFIILYDNFLFKITKHFNIQRIHVIGFIFIKTEIKRFKTF